MYLLDSNVLIDLLNPHSQWAAWSATAVARASSISTLAINHVILAELNTSVRAGREFETLRGTLAIQIVPLTDLAAILAGRAHGEYRRNGGGRTSILPDFLIGGHCAALGAAFITRDRRRFAGYFPELELIAPEDNDG